MTYMFILNCALKLVLSKYLLINLTNLRVLILSEISYECPVNLMSERKKKFFSQHRFEIAVNFITPLI